MYEICLLFWLAIIIFTHLHTYHKWLKYLKIFLSNINFKVGDASVYFI